MDPSIIIALHIIYLLIRALQITNKYDLNRRTFKIKIVEFWHKIALGTGGDKKWRRPNFGWYGKV